MDRIQVEGGYALKKRGKNPHEKYGIENPTLLYLFISTEISVILHFHHTIIKFIYTFSHPYHFSNRLSLTR